MVRAHDEPAVASHGPLKTSATLADQSAGAVASRDVELPRVRLARASEGLVRDESLLADCKRRADENPSLTPWSFLMNPKTGGSSMVKWAGFCRPEPRRRMHQGLYEPCSIASMREPCSRARSAFANLRSECLRNCHLQVPFNDSTPGARGSCAGSEVTACRLSNHDTFLGFAKYLKLHWQKAVMAMPLVVQGIRRVNVMVFPQYLWVGNASQIVCTEKMDTELPKVAASVGLRCPKTPIPHEDHGIHRNETDTLKPDTSGDMEACQIIRGLYDADVQLWRRYCGGDRQLRQIRGDEARSRSAG